MPESSSVTILEGICHFHSEAGTEGGYWAFQETRYIRRNVGRGYCKKCGKWLKEQNGVIRIERVYPITEELMRKCQLPKLSDCPKNTHEEDVGDMWDYQGLHILEDGDHLTIYSKESPNEIVWVGIIRLRHYPIFTEHAFGFWIHADQEGVDRETWSTYFLQEYPGELISAGV